MIVAIFLLAVSSTSTHAAQVIGSIDALPPTDLEDLTTWPPLDALGAFFTKKNFELHTWTKFCLGENKIRMRLDWSIVGGDNFLVTLYYNTLILDKALAGRFDGELTRSVTVEKSTATSHTVTWLMSDSTCNQRVYHTEKSKDGWTLVGKIEKECRFPDSILNLLNVDPTRKNLWVWGDRPLSSWGLGKKYLWGGSVVNLPEKSGVASDLCKRKNLLHIWDHSMAKNYKLLLYRTVDANDNVHFYIETRYEDMILDSGIEVNRFDDEMLASVTIKESQTLNEKKVPMRQTDNFQVAYKMNSGECVVRVYTMVTNEKPQPISKVTRKLEVNCAFFYQQKAYYDSMLATSVNQNGWTY